MHEILKLDNQLCFQLYSANRMMTKLYKPYLSPYDLTYPQYLVLLVLFEAQTLTVKALGEKLYLDSGTLTPLLKRMEKNNLVVRVRSAKDERSVQISLTEVGRCLEEKLLDVPLALCRNHNVELKRIEALRDNIKDLMETVMS